MSDPIPPNIFAAIKAWLEQRKTGEITLKIREGRILGAHFGEEMKAQ